MKRIVLLLPPWWFRLVVTHVLMFALAFAFNESVQVGGKAYFALWAGAAIFGLHSSGRAWLIHGALFRSYLMMRAPEPVVIRERGFLSFLRVRFGLAAGSTLVTTAGLIIPPSLLANPDAAKLSTPPLGLVYVLAIGVLLLAFEWGMNYHTEREEVIDARALAALPE